MYGGEFTSISNWEQFPDALLQDQNKDGLRVIEIMTNRNSNAEEHRKLWEFVSREIDSLLEKENS